MADTSKHSFQILVNGVVFKDGQVLISQRSWEEEFMPGRWTIPGGKVEHLDKLLVSLVRNSKLRRQGVQLFAGT